MATLNLSIEGPSIRRSYLSIINGPVPSGSSPTAATWALFSVKAPLLSAFQDTSATDSILRVQTTGSGDLSDLFEDFSEGHVQFAFLKVKDPNSGLPKNVLIAWCGGGVPERTKGYFMSHMNAVSNVLHGYHVQVTARSDSDLDPDALMQRVADASGAKYSAAGSNSGSAPAPPPPAAKKPVFTPTAASSHGRFNPPVAARSQRSPVGNDNDGWGADAPPITRTQLEKVEPAYKPIKVSMAELMKNRDESTRSGFGPSSGGPVDLVRGAYQPVGRVDIAALRAQAERDEDDRPARVAGAYEPTGKVDIAAIRAKSQKSAEQTSKTSSEPLAAPSAAYSKPPESERITSLPKPKVAKKFGAAAAFTGTKPPTPGALGFSGSSPTPAVPPVGAASRTFADQGGKTPAQLWAEKKAQHTGAPTGLAPSATSPSTSQQSTSGWKSSYTGKSWSVEAPTYKRDAPAGVQAHATGDSSSKDASSAGLSVVKDRVADASCPVPGVSKSAPDFSGVRPALPDSTRPTGGLPLPAIPAGPAEPEPEEEDFSRNDHYERDGSPVRIAMPVGRGAGPDPQPPARDAEVEPAPVPAPPPVSSPVDPPRGPEPERQGYDDTGRSGRRALIQYDYEKAEDNEIELRENEYVTNIDMVDEDWWIGTNSLRETGLFPSNYVELVDNDNDVKLAAAPHLTPLPASSTPAYDGPTAVALYDYEAAEDNELSFPEGAEVAGLEFPDEDWWFGHYNGHTGLFPANYVERNT